MNSEFSVQMIRDKKQEFIDYRQLESIWVSKFVARTVGFITDDRNHRQEADSLYNAVQQLMTGKIPHFLLSHGDWENVLTQTQNYLRQHQPHMTLSRLDFRYYYSEATFTTVRRGDLFFSGN